MKLVLLPGDDIGPELTRAARHVVEAVDARFRLNLEIEVHDVGMASHRKEGTTLPERVLQAAAAADGIILGPAGITAYPPLDAGGINVPATVRKRLDLYANIRPFRSRQGIPDTRPGIDLVFVRENTEGFYADRNMFAGTGEFMPTPDVALAVRKITAAGSRRIARSAFELAAKRRKQVTAIGKEHVLKLTDGLFMREARELARAHPEIEYREMDVDAFAAALYSRTAEFDVILTTNMFGDILTNVAAAMAGGMGFAAALNVGDEHAAANAGHGSAPDIAGRDDANPTGLILSTAMLLEWLGTRHHRKDLCDGAAAIERTIDALLSEPQTRTRDLGGPLGTQGFGQAVAERIATHVLSAA